MQNNQKAYDIMKGEIKQTLKNFDKIIKVNEVDIDYFNKQSTDSLLAKIQEKLDLNSEESKNANNKEEGKKKDKLNTKALEANMEDDFRNFNMYIPKLKLNETQNNKNTFTIRKSVFEDCLVTKINDLKMSSNGLKESRLIKLEKFQKYNVDPFIFLNKFYSYSYSDETDKKITTNKNMNDTIIYNALNKAITENLNQINKSKNPLFEIYYKLYQWEEKESELENYSNKIREDELIFDPKEENDESNEKKRDKKTESEQQKKTLADTTEKQFTQSSQKYKEMILKKTRRLNMRTNEKYTEFMETLNIGENIIFHLNGSITFPSGFKIINFTPSDNEEKKKSKEERYDASSIAFGIMIKGVIEKRIRRTALFHTRGLSVEGPIVTWYRYSNSEITNEVKGILDMRRKENRINEDREDKRIFLKRYQKEKNGEEFTDDLEFKAEPLEYYGKTFKDIFNQVRVYFNTLNNIRNKLDYSKLKYFSDSQIESYIQSPYDIRAGIIETLDWHLKLKKLHLKGIDKNYLKFIFNNLINTEIFLESLSFETAVNSTNLNNNSIFELEVFDSMKTFFSSRLCEKLTDVHFINFRYENGLKNLFDCLALKFDYIRKKIKTDVGTDNRNAIDIPYKNITIKRKEPSLQTVIDLNNLYNFFTKMANVAEGIHNFKQPFEKLDISGCDATNLEGLKNIINKFKIIKELDISGTK
jgi:hypothetical protein